jgi:hypothetical protein
MRRPFASALAAGFMLSACAGHVADHIGSRTGIMAPELSRYGLGERQAACVGAILADDLRPRQLRLFARAAGSVQRGYFDPQRLTFRDLMHVAASMDDPQVSTVLVRAASSCDTIAGATGAAPIMEPASTEDEAEARPEAWVNLGAAPTGQSIAVDAGSVAREGDARTAWFRLTNPGEPQSGNTYLLRIDCPGRTINAMARRKQDEAGETIEYRDFGPEGEGRLDVEGGTVMEIAWLAMCT